VAYDPDDLYENNSDVNILGKVISMENFPFEKGWK